MTDIISTSDKLKCAQRELARRKLGWREEDTMNASNIACMEAIVADYEEQERLEQTMDFLYPPDDPETKAMIAGTTVVTEPNVSCETSPKRKGYRRVSR